jgi:geranylgeranyl reductase family protein
MSNSYDVAVVGGSVSGLLAAREISSLGLSVVVLEEDSEIGTPEHCGGLVSVGGLQQLGVAPSMYTLENTIKFATIFSASKSFEVNADNQKVVVIDRRSFDKQLAFQAQDNGAEIRVRCSMRSHDYNSSKNSCILRTSEGEIECKYIVDARGVGSIINRDRNGILQSAQYEVYADWIERDRIQVRFDAKRFPGFFAWIIPIGFKRAKVGVAGRAINAATALNGYLTSMGRHNIIRKVYAPIWIKGPIKNFVEGNIVIIGDAAGQTKPTTAGGIYTCGMGGIIAGRSIAKAIDKKDPKFLNEYAKTWSSIFKTEFDKMLLTRMFLERLDNKSIDDLFDNISNNETETVSKMGDFDFHSEAVSKLLGARGAMIMAKTILGSEFRRLFG